MATTGRDAPRQYEFRISGRLDPRWQSWFDGMAVAHDDDLTTTLRGELIDQAALYGVLGRLRDLGVTLLSMRVVDDTHDDPNQARTRPRRRVRRRRVEAPTD